MKREEFVHEFTGVMCEAIAAKPKTTTLTRDLVVRATRRRNILVGPKVTKGAAPENPVMVSLMTLVKINQAKEITAVSVVIMFDLIETAWAYYEKHAE